MKTMTGVLSAIVLLAAAAAAHGVTVNFDVGNQGYALYTDVGAAPDTGTLWTQTFTTTANLPDSFGNATAIDLTINSGWAGTSTQTVSGTYFNNLTRDRFYTIGSGDSPQFGFAGLDPAKTYNAYLYMTKHSTSFKLTSTGAERTAIGWTQATGPADFHEADTYAAFRGLTGASSQMFTLKGIASEGWAGGGTYGVLAGMQIQEVAKPGALKQYWAFDDGASDPTSRTAANAIETGNTGLMATYTADKTPPPGNWVTSGLAPKLTSRATAPSTSALDLDPSNPYDYVDGGHINQTTTSSSGEATLSMWLNPDSLVEDTRLYGQITPGGTHQGALRIGPGGNVEVYPGAAWQELIPAGGLAVNSWQHLALVWNGDQMTAYLDGVQKSTVTSQFNFDGSPNAVGFGIGAKYRGTYGISFDGQVDDVAVFDRALKNHHIEALSNGMLPFDVLDVVPKQFVVNVDVQRSDGVDYVGLGAAPDDANNTYWNVLSSSGVTDLTASDGISATPIDVSISNVAGLTTQTTPPNYLQRDRAYTIDGVGNFEISGLDSGCGYDIYLFGGVYATNYTIGGVTKTASGVTGDAGYPWIEGDDYVLFKGLTGLTSILGTFQKGAGSSYGVLSGIQIRQVPEPCSMVLLALGLMGLIGVRRRRK